jgi:CheY-like chemotaxis protein
MESTTQIRSALADDVAGTRMSIVRMLERLGHQVICAASNGAELVEQCSGKEIDLVRDRLGYAGTGWVGRGGRIRR